MSLVCSVVSDLIFSTKLTGTARTLGVPMRVVRDLTQLQQALEVGAAMVIVDLDLDHADPLAMIRTVKSTSPQARVLAYVSHVRVDLANAAQAAGADQVMPRSKFSAALPEILEPYRLNNQEQVS